MNTPLIRLSFIVGHEGGFSLILKIGGALIRQAEGMIKAV